MMFVNCTKVNACADPGNYFMGRGCGGYIVCGGGSGSGSGGQSPFSIFRELSDPFLDPRMKCKPLYIYFSLRFRALICNSNIYN